MGSVSSIHQYSSEAVINTKTTVCSEQWAISPGFLLGILYKQKSRPIEVRTKPQISLASHVRRLCEFRRQRGGAEAVLLLSEIQRGWGRKTRPAPRLTSPPPTFPCGLVEACMSARILYTHGPSCILESFEREIKGETNKHVWSQPAYAFLALACTCTYASAG